MTETLHRDLVVIGAGPGGYVAALRTAQKGLRVTLVEKRFIGGTCLNVGCIPTKSLIHAADVFQAAKNASQYGVNTENVTVDFARVAAKKDAVVETLVKGVSFLLEKAGVETVRGTAAFAGPHEIDVATDEGTRRYEADYVIIATGAKTRSLAIPGFDLPVVFDSEGILSLPSLPASLVVIGGGIIGM
ncbi:MAG: FAD-dependent oxidoreductase, partial [Bacillota bacterium]|nr:FAD-dependent oxidoreductase [Bacillota bacterium]